MNTLVQESSDREIIQAIGADEPANTNCYQILRRFIPSKSACSEEQPYQPDARPGAGGLKEIDSAWLLLQTTGKSLDRAYMKLRAAFLWNAFAPSKWIAAFFTQKVP
ncbi:hypothetical protein ACFLWU_01010 [Chloroflexota bacterium]